MGVRSTSLGPFSVWIQSFSGGAEDASAVPGGESDSINDAASEFVEVEAIDSAVSLFKLVMLELRE